MEILNFEQCSQEWLDARMGKITGSKLNDIVVKRGTGKKIGFYELLADKLAVQTEEQDGMDRGKELENEAVELFAKTINKKIEKVGLCVSDENPNIAVSPDGLIKENDKYTEAVEVKCLSTPRHLMAYFEKEIPSEYELQVVQYFIVNKDLQKLYFVFYDPRVTAKPIHWIEVNRETIKEDIEKYFNYQVEVLKEIDNLLIELTF